MHHPLRSIALATALLALTACSDPAGGGSNNGANNGANNGQPNNGQPNNGQPNNGQPNNGQPNNGEPVTCGSDDDCPPTGRCQGEVCVSRAACDSVDACSDGEVCNSCLGRCEAFVADTPRVCVEDQNCLIDQFCDTCRSVCRQLAAPCEPCEEDVQCGEAGDLCLDLRRGDRVCGQACADVTDCPRGFACEAVQAGVQQCVPRSGDCASPGECEDHDDCPLGEQCGPLLSCVPGCTEGTCPNEQVCDAGACKPPCAADADCPQGAECTPDGLCRVPGGCLTSRDCPDAATYCDTDAQMCREGCAVDDDCPGLQVCSENQCRNRPCDGNHLCGFGQVCNKDTGLCVAPEGPYCDMCDAEAENQCGGEPNQCLRIQDEEGNALGDFCGVACDPDDLDACPVGYRCQELRDQDDMVVGNVCFRSCHRDPV